MPRLAIRLWSVHSKLVEMIMLLADKVSSTQFGFRKGSGTSFCNSFLNDIGALPKSKGSTIYTCNLDVEKCFDRFWHDGLFHKLWGVLTVAHWLFLYTSYNSFSAVVRWDWQYSTSFNITIGTRREIYSPLTCLIIIILGWVIDWIVRNRHWCAYRYL